MRTRKTRIGSVLGTLLLTVGLFACGQEGTDPTSSAPVGDEEAAPVPTALSASTSLSSLTLAVAPVAVSLDPTEISRDAMGHSRQNVYVFADGPNHLRGVHFGIEYDGGVKVLGWTAAVDAMELDSEYWPGSGSWKALAWGADEPAAEGGRQLLGYLTIEAGSKGAVRLTGLPAYSGNIGVSGELGETGHVRVNSRTAEVRLSS